MQVDSSWSPLASPPPPPWVCTSASPPPPPPITAATPSSLAPATPQVYVPPHPLVKHWLAIARNAATPPPLFRSACAELGRVLIYEAVREFLPTLEGQVDTPVGPADVEFVDPTKPIKVVPILRAGLVLLEQAGTVLPCSETYHVGYVRDEVTLKVRVVSFCWLWIWFGWRLVRVQRARRLRPLLTAAAARGCRTRAWSRSGSSEGSRQESRCRVI